MAAAGGCGPACIWTHDEAALEHHMLNLANDTRIEKKSGPEPLFSSVNAAEATRARSWLESRLHEGRRLTFTEERPVLISPAVAEIMLERNEGNRPLRTVTVEKYRRAIREGRWRTTHQGIAFDRHGTLRDGQHRLSAIAAEGRPVRMTVTFGLEPEAFAVMDTGRIRNAGDVLTINNRGGGRDLGAAARCYLIARGVNPRSKRTIDNDEIDAFVAATPGFVKFYESGAHVRASLKCGAGLIAGLYIVNEIGRPATVADFMNKVRTGVGFTDKRDAGLVLRTSIIAGLIPSHRPLDMAASVVLAWNLWAQGRPARTSSLRWSDAAFPVPVRC